MESFKRCFEGLEDPRAENARHDLLEILMIALAAMVCGAQTCTDMALFGRAKRSLLERFLRLEHGIPSHDTFSRLFRLLDPDAFHQCFGRFMDAFAGAAQAEASVVALDGKTARRSFDRAAGGTPLHVVSAWASETGLVLAQRAVKPGANENEAVLAILGLLRLDGVIVTADAMHCQRRIAEAILARGGAYVLALKSNHPGLLDDVRLLLADPQAPPDDVAETVDGDHGRIETRRATVLSDVEYLQAEHDFPGLRAVAKVEACREIGGRTERSTRHFVLSAPMSAARLLEVVRAHWGIENGLHWVLDMTFDEDRARNRKDHGPENLALLRRLAINLLKAAPENASIRAKIKLAGWDEQFLLATLANAHMR